MFGQPINESTLYLANHKAYTVLEQPEAEIRQQLAGQAVAHFDETGIRVKARCIGSIPLPLSCTLSVHP